MSDPIVTIEMENGGVIKAELYPEIAPNTVNNFLSLVKKGFYDGLLFSAVIPGFMIARAADPQGTGTETGRPGLLGSRVSSRRTAFSQTNNRPARAGRAVHGAGRDMPDSGGQPVLHHARRRPPTWTASTPPSARSSRAWTWWTPSPTPPPTGTTAPRPSSADEEGHRRYLRYLVVLSLEGLIQHNRRPFLLPL